MSKQPAKILGVEEYPSAIAAIRQHGVTLCHTTKQEFDALTASSDKAQLCEKIRAARATEQPDKTPRKPQPTPSPA